MIKIDQDKCVGCGYCAARCPYGCISLEPGDNKALVCDFCQDNDHQPRCVEYCPKEALTYEEAKEGSWQWDLLQKQGQRGDGKKEEKPPEGVEAGKCCKC